MIGVSQHDRFLLCSDGVYGVLSGARLAGMVADRVEPEQTARAWSRRRSRPAQPTMRQRLLLTSSICRRRILRNSWTRFSTCLFRRCRSRAMRSTDFASNRSCRTGATADCSARAKPAAGRPLAIKFPHPRVATEATYRLAFAREAWSRSAGAQPLCRRGDRVAARPTEPALRRHAFLRRRDPGAAVAPRAARTRARRRRNDKTRARTRRAASRRHRASRRQA